MSARSLSSLLCLMVMTLLFASASYAANPEASSFGNVILPAPLKPVQAAQCVEPVDVMRRDHMEFLFHQRDQTVLNGIREEKYSLTGCIDCHAQKNDKGEFLRADDPEYFCTSCHTYASVKIDCFECHADRPMTRIDNTQLDLAKQIQRRNSLPLASRNHDLLPREPLRND